MGEEDDRQRGHMTIGNGSQSMERIRGIKLGGKFRERKCFDCISCCT